VPVEVARESSRWPSRRSSREGRLHPGGAEPLESGPPVSPETRAIRPCHGLTRQRFRLILRRCRRPDHSRERAACGGSSPGLPPAVL